MNYKVCLTTKVKPSGAGSGILVIEPEDYTKDEISALKKAGYKVLGYLNVGAVEDYRSYYKDLKPYRLSKLEDWDHEWYIDVRRTVVREWAVKRAKEIKAQGFDGWWIDNLDVYEYHKSGAMYTAIKTVLKKIKALGGYVMVNGAAEFMDYRMDHDSDHKSITYIDGVTQEEVYSLITDYDGKGKFGEQTKEMHKWYKHHMKRILRHGMDAFLLEYTRSNTLKLRIKSFCVSYGMTGYYVSSDKDL